MYLLAVPVKVEEHLKILIESRTKSRLQLHFPAAISYMTSIYIAPSPSQRSLVSTSSPGSPRTNEARASAWLLRTGFQKQFLSNFGEGKFDFVVFRSPHHGCFRQTSELARFKKEGNQCSLYRARQQREDNHNQ